MRQDDAFAALTRKLSVLADLNDADRQAIRGLPSSVEAVSAGRHLVREGTAPTDCCLLISGYACRYKLAANGGRQIVSFHIPGDLLDLQHLFLFVADHHVETITPAEIAWIPKANLRALARERPAIAEAFWRDTLIDASIFREWVLNVGRRSAKSRIAHMLCEFVARCQAAGLARAEGFAWPMTQEQIADATGLTPVHVNRMLKALSAEGAIERRPRGHAVRDWHRLKQIGDFDQIYLHAAA
jgi:CRP-like cAMP-binding protein